MHLARALAQQRLLKTTRLKARLHNALQSFSRIQSQYSPPHRETKPKRRPRGEESEQSTFGSPRISIGFTLSRRPDIYTHTPTRPRRLFPKRPLDSLFPSFFLLFFFYWGTSARVLSEPIVRARLLSISLCRYRAFAASYACGERFSCFLLFLSASLSLSLLSARPPRVVFYFQRASARARASFTYFAFLFTPRRERDFVSVITLES